MQTSAAQRGFALLLIFVVSMGLISCGDGRKEVAGTAPSPTGTPEIDDPCKNTTASNRASEIKRYLDKHSMRDEELNDQRYDGNFSFDVVPYYVQVNNVQELKILVRVYGRVLGYDGGDDKKPPKMKNFLTFLEKGMKRGCIDRVSFEPTPTTTPPGGTAAQDVRGFEWQACPYPEFACQPGGYCSSGGQCLTTKSGEAPGPAGTPAPSQTPTPTPTPTGTPKT